MKKNVIPLLAALLLITLCLCGCGGESTENAQTQPSAADAAQTPAAEAVGTPAAPAAEETPAPAAAESAPAASAPETPVPAAEEKTETAEPAAPAAARPQSPMPTSQPAAPAEAPVNDVPDVPTEPEADQKTVAAGFIGRSVTELYAAIGMPAYSDYAPSCLSEGAEDGNLYYDGFIVYTYRENGAEEVSYVE